MPDAHDAPPDDDHLVVLTPKSHHFLNSTAVNHARLRTMAGGPSVLLAAADAAARDVVDGELVELTQRHRHHDGAPHASPARCSPARRCS